jgi:hypothetical protein
MPLSSLSVSCICLVLASASSFAQSAFRSTNEAPYYAKGDGIANDGPALRQALTAGHSVYVPAGTYLVDNSAGPLTISDFSNTLEFSRLAQVVCTTPNKGCLWFVGGTSPKFLNVQVTYAVNPTNDCRGGETGCVSLMFDGQVDPVIQGTRVENAWAIAVSVNNTRNARVLDTAIRSATRDGLFLQDNQNIEIRDVTVAEVGDDCVGFHSTTSGGGREGGTASGITCLSIRGGGLAFAGGRNLRVSDFVINGTSAQGIYVVSDPSTYAAPGNITLSNGVLRGVGSVTDSVPRKGTQHGIQYYTAAGPNIGPLEFHDIVIDSVSGYGIYGFNAQSVQFKNIHISNAGLDGAVSNGSCAQFVYNGSVTLSKFTARECYRAGILAIQNSNLVIDNAAVTNAWKKGVQESGAKAFDLISNESIQVSDVSIVDNSNPPTGYTFSESQNGSGAVNGISSQIRFGRLSLIAGSPSVSVEK